ncbi:response regulator, partial [Vibrio parahaemolyticus AQ3810]
QLSIGCLGASSFSLNITRVNRLV